MYLKIGINILGYDSVEMRKLRLIVLTKTWVMDSCLIFFVHPPPKKNANKTAISWTFLLSVKMLCPQYSVSFCLFLFESLFVSVLVSSFCSQNIVCLTGCLFWSKSLVSFWCYSLSLKIFCSWKKLYTFKSQNILSFENVLLAKLFASTSMCFT